MCMLPLKMGFAFTSAVEQTGRYSRVCKQAIPSLEGLLPESLRPLNCLKTSDEVNLFGFSGGRERKGFREEELYQGL